MATQVDWTNMKPAGKKGRSRDELYVKLESGVPKTVRPIGPCCHFYQFFVNKRPISVDESEKDAACAILSSHFGKEIIPRHRFAINVIDRGDNKMRILEGGSQIFSHFANWSEANNKEEPGGKAGFDWSIRATGDGLSREYTATAVRPAPLTKDEMERIKTKGETVNLQEHYAGVPANEILKKISENSEQAETESSDVNDPVLW